MPEVCQSHETCKVQLRRDNETRDAEIAGLRALIDQRRSAGFVSLEDSEREIDAMLERKRRDRAAL